MIIEKYKEVKTRELLDCRLKAIQEVLRSIDIELSAYEIMLLAGSFSFNYGNINFSNLQFYDLPYCTASENEIEKKVFDRLGISYIEEKIGSSPSEWEHIKELLDRGIPILFNIDARFMNYKDKSTSTIDLHYLSTILLVGYKDDLSSVYIILTHDDGINTPQELSFEDFSKYRNTKCIPFSPENRCVYILPEQNTNLSFSFKDVFLESCMSIYDRFTSVASKKLEIPNFECNELFKGFVAMDMLGEKISAYRKELEKNKDVRSVKYVCLALLFLKKNLMFGSYSAFRYEFGKCLTELSEKLGILELDRAASYFKESARLWRGFFVYISKIPHDTEHIVFYLMKVELILRRIKEYEKKGFSILKRGMC